MSKAFFEFKQFKAYHDRCAMKVGTDGVLLGAWTDLGGKIERALDVGTGSALVALMLAQRSADRLHIDAIDIDAGAIEQSLYNVDLSPFSNIYIYHQSLEAYSSLSDGGYDLIVSNPPYFVSSLTSPDYQRTLARHTQTLGVEDLLKHSEFMLNDAGRLSIIYPSDLCDLVLDLASKNNLYPKRITHVYPTPTSKSKRVLFEFIKTPCRVIEDNLLLETSRHVYSPAFYTLVKDFYLKL